AARPGSSRRCVARGPVPGIATRLRPELRARDRVDARRERDRDERGARAGALPDGGIRGVQRRRRGRLGAGRSARRERPRRADADRRSAVRRAPVTVYDGDHRSRTARSPTGSTIPVLMEHGRDTEDDDGNVAPGPPDDLEGELARARTELNAHKLRIAVLERKLERAETKLETVIGSLSWRITLPIRRGSSLAHRVLGRIRHVFAVMTRLVAGTRLVWWLSSVFLPGRPRLLHLPGEATMPPQLGDGTIARAAVSANQHSHAAVPA